MNRTSTGRGWWVAGSTLLAAAGVLLASCTSLQRTLVVSPLIPGASYIGNAQCYYCHTNYSHSFQGNVHFRVRSSLEALPGGTSCESCHGPGSKHAAAPRERTQFIVNPRKEPQACYSCHQDVELQFRLPQHHPVAEGRMNCVQCHDPHGREIFKPAPGSGHGRIATPSLAMARLNEQCSSCHREQARAFVFEHEAMREGCVSCHNPHGSINAKLLTERDSNLCLKCHAQLQTGSGEVWIGNSPHQANLLRGSCWSAGCHTAVHGSNFQPTLLY